jgi:hypothetical protein
MKSYPLAKWTQHNGEPCVVTQRQLTKADSENVQTPCFGGGTTESEITQVEVISANGARELVRIGEYEHKDHRGHIYSVTYC